jgi:hypothetical protein
MSTVSFKVKVGSVIREMWADDLVDKIIDDTPGELGVVENLQHKVQNAGRLISHIIHVLSSKNIITDDEIKDILYVYDYQILEVVRKED